MDKVLYFPQMSIPNNASWVLQMLFYWDELQCIIPYSCMKRPDEFSLLTQSLLQEGLLQPVYPEDYIYSIQDFSTNFMKYIDAELSNCTFTSKSWPYKRIHMGKMSHIGKSLVAHGLAFRDGEWFCVEKCTAEAFMTYLAVVLSGKTDSVPITNTFSRWSRLATDDNSSIPSARHRLRNSILPNLMPVPSQMSDIGDLHSILRFKDRHRTELISFRTHMEQFLMDLENTPEHQQDEKRRRFIQDFEEQRKIISDKMQSRFRRVAFSTFCSILSPVVTTAVIGSNHPIANIAIPSASGLFNAIYSVYASNQMYLKTSPIAYAAYVSRRFGSR